MTTVTIADAPHGRSRYTRGCRCGTCRQANREYQRARRAKHLRAVPGTNVPNKPSAQQKQEPAGTNVPVPPRDPQPAEFIDGPVTEAVRAQLVEAIIAQERPGLIAIAIRLAQLLDNDSATPQHASASHRLMEVLTALSKTSTRRGRLSLVRTMTGPSSPGNAK